MAELVSGHKVKDFKPNEEKAKLIESQVAKVDKDTDANDQEAEEQQNSSSAIDVDKLKT
jgi:hypothetical protein